MKPLDMMGLKRRRDQGRLNAIDAENLLDAVIMRDVELNALRRKLADVTSGAALDARVAQAERTAAFAVGENARNAEMADGAVLILAEAHQLALRLQAITQRSAHYVSVRAQLSTGTAPVQRETNEPQQLAAG